MVVENNVWISRLVRIGKKSVKEYQSRQGGVT
jgi:hypothetical protein